MMKLLDTLGIALIAMTLGTIGYEGSGLTLYMAWLTLEARKEAEAAHA